MMREQRSESRPGRNFLAGILCILGLGLCPLAVNRTMAQENPFEPKSPFKTSGEKPIVLLDEASTAVAAVNPSAGQEFMLWPAVVQDKDGIPVIGLERKEFVLRIGKPTVEPLFHARRNVPAESTGDTETGAVYRPVGWYLVFFDISVADPLEIQRAAGALKGVLSQWLGPHDLMAVVQYDGQIQVLCPFTADPRTVGSALDRLTPRAAYDLNDFFGGRVMVTARGERAKMSSEIDRSDDQAQHNFASKRFFKQMRRLTDKLSEIPGRKQLILLSAGYNRKFLTLEEVDYYLMVDALSRAGTAVYPYFSVGEDYSERLIEEEGIRRKRMERAGDSDLKQASKFLAELALVTGGISWTPDKDMGHHLSAVLQDGRNHYLLGIPKPSGPPSGEFRAVEITVDGGGSEIRSAAGYYDN